MGGSSWARLNKTRRIDTAEKIEAEQNEFWKLFGRFVEIKRHAMTKHAAIFFELPGSCDYWKDERLHEVVHDGTSHDFDGCRYGLKQRYTKKPLPIKKPRRVVSWNFELGDSLSKKCNGNHEHGPCAGRETKTKEAQLHTSLIVNVILRRFLARAKCLQQTRLQTALACTVRGNPRRRQTAVRENHITSTVPSRFRASPKPLVTAGCSSNPFSTHCCLFWGFLVLENIIKMTANESVVNTNDRGHRRPRHICLLSVLFCEMPRHDEGRRAIHEDRVGVSQQDLPAAFCR